MRTISIIDERHVVPLYLRSVRTAPTAVTGLLPPGPWRRGWRACRRLAFCFLKASAILAAVAAAAVVVAHLHYAGRAVAEDFSTIPDLPERIELFDGGGRFFASIPWGTTRHSVRSVDELPQALIDALVTMEDRDFFEHGGVNWRGVARAVAHDARHASLQHGGSGITQQLAKMWKFGIPKDESVWAKFDRKFLEWHLAKRIEATFSKGEILCHYLNRIDFGGGFQGVYAASEGFFGKPPKDLGTEDAATLIAILRGPGIYSPIDHAENCKARRDRILREMAKAGKISEPEFRRLAALPLATKYQEWAARQRSNEESRLAAKELRTSGIPEEVLKKGGLRVTLTIDREWDEHCAALTKAHLDRLDTGTANHSLQAAALVIETRTGAIRVLQGGRGVAGDQLDRVFQSWRQVGSTVKPFVYELAFAGGIDPECRVRNDAIAPGELWPGVNWSPANSGDKGDVITCRDGLIFSQNRVTVRVGTRVGLPVLGNLLERLGICPAAKVSSTPSALIGTFEARLVDLARAFTIFPQEGYECPKPHIIESVQSKEGESLFRASTESTLVADPAGCRITAGCLREVFTRGTAKSALQEVSAKAIGKTGSTNGSKDCWFVGADERFTCAVWVGCDKPTTLKGGSGAKFALPLWAKIMQRDDPNRVAR